MSYTIYTDKNENFECEVSVKNASLKGSIARLIVESDVANLVFNGRIDGDKCIVPIKRLKGLLDENTRGKMHLEVIVEDTYFKPWESEFIVEEHTSIKVKVNENKQSTQKPMVEVKTKPTLKSSKPKKSKNNETDIHVPLKEIVLLCEKFGIENKNFKKKMGDFSQLIREYFNNNPEYKKYSKSILNNIKDYIK